MGVSLLAKNSAGLGASQPVEVSQAFMDSIANASANVGAPNGTGVTVTDGFAAVHYQRLTFTDVEVAMTDNTTAGCHGGLKIYDFPSALVTILGALSALHIEGLDTGVDNDAAVVASLGTAVVSNADATLTSTEANVIASTAATFTSAEGDFNGVSSAPVQLNGTVTPVDLYLNFAVPGGDADGADTFTVSGFVDLYWINHGDH